jgi:hypothetical protein
MYDQRKFDLDPLLVRVLIDEVANTIDWLYVQV